MNPHGVLDLRSQARAVMPALGTIEPELAAAAVPTWQARMSNEYTSSAVFEALARQIVPVFGPALAHECRTFADEERSHGIACGAVVEALGGKASVPLPVARRYPEHAGVPPRAAVLRNVIHVACMSETVAVALIGAERFAMPAGPLRRLLTRIWADEVGHARFGWRLLEHTAGELTPAERDAIERYLPVAFEHLEAHELSHLPVRAAPRAGAALGLCDGREGRSLFYETLEGVIRPGLRRWFRC